MYLQYGFLYLILIRAKFFTVALATLAVYYNFIELKELRLKVPEFMAPATLSELEFLKSLWGLGTEEE